LRDRLFEGMLLGTQGSEARSKTGLVAFA
jgi:hypothetical protein